MQGEKRRDNGHTIVVPVSQWEIDTVREDLIARIEAQKEFLVSMIAANDRLTQSLFEADHKAVAIAVETINDRLELLNEFRKQSADRDQSFISRTEALSKFENISETASGALPRTEALAKLEALRNSIDAVRDRVIKIESSAGGAQQNWSGILAALGGLGVFVAIALGLMAFFNQPKTPQPVIGVEPPVRVTPK